VLGWEPVDKKVFCLLTNLDQSSPGERLIYFDLKGSHADRPVRVMWWTPEFEDSSRATRWKAIARRLKALPLEVSVSIPQSTSVLKVDTLRTQWGDITRFHVGLSGFRNNALSRVEAITFRDPSVRLLSLHGIPGRPEKVAIFSFIGMDDEGGYETQVPMLVSGTSKETLRVEARRRR
jgi:hypothetical protein